MAQKKKRKVDVAARPGNLNRPWFLFFSMAILAVLAFYPELYGGFVFDDPHYVEFNPNLDSLRELLGWDLFWRRRPLYWLSFFIQKQMWGNNPMGYKIVSLAAHIATAFVLIRFTEIVCRKKKLDHQWIPVLAGFLFLLHPMTMEAVAYISGQTNGLGAFFFVLGLTLFARWSTGEAERKRKHLVFAILSFIVALLFKEIFIVSIILCPVFYWWLKLEPGQPVDWKRPALLVTGAVIVMALILFLVPVHPIPRFKQAFLDTLTGANVQALATNSYAILYSLRLFIFPDALNIDHDLPVLTSYGDIRFMLSMVGFIVLGVVFWLLRKRLPLALPCYFTYILLILPSNSVILRRGDWMIDPISERNLYGSALFFAIFAAGLLVNTLKNRRVLVGVLAVLLLVLSVRTHLRARDYHDDISLWTSAVKYSPERVRPHFNLAVALNKAGQIESATRHARKVVEYSLDTRGFGLLASLYGKSGKTSMQQATLERGIYRGQGDKALLWSQLGQLHYERDHWGKAESALRKSLELDPQFLKPRLTLAYILLSQERMTDAREQISRLDTRFDALQEEFRAQELLDDTYKALYHFAKGWYDIDEGADETGVVQLKQAIALNPTFVEPYLKLGDYYYRAGQYQESWSIFVAASRQPTFIKYSEQVKPYMDNLPKLLQNPDLDPGL